MVTTKQIAKAALFNEAGELLILTRSQTDPTRPGRFDFAGGSIDAGESPLDAVIREINEEIGIEIAADKLHLMYSATTWYEDLSTIRFLFVGNVRQGADIRLSYEHDKWQWMPVDEALKLYDHPVWIEGLKYLLDHNIL